MVSDETIEALYELENNIPAFPSRIENHSQQPLTGFLGEAVEPGKFQAYPGMRIRDYFAAKAMQSLTPVYWEDFDTYNSGAELIKCLCETAYEMADAMLAERSKP